MADDDMSSSEVRQRLSSGAGIAVGMGLGVAAGAALDNMGVGVVIGIAAGTALALVISRIGRARPRGAQPESEPTEDPDR